MDPEVTKVIDRYRKNLEMLGINVSRIILYGSRASGSFRPDSDLDLLVVSDSLDGLDLWDRLTLLGRARAGIDFPMEIQGMTVAEFTAAAKSGFVADEVLPTGIVVG